MVKRNSLTTLFFLLSLSGCSDVDPAVEQVREELEAIKASAQQMNEMFASEREAYQAIEQLAEVLGKNIEDAMAFCEGVNSVDCDRLRESVEELPTVVSAHVQSTMDKIEQLEKEL